MGGVGGFLSGLVLEGETASIWSAEVDAVAPLLRPGEKSCETDAAAFDSATSPRGSNSLHSNDCPFGRCRNFLTTAASDAVPGIGSVPLLVFGLPTATAAAAAATANDEDDRFAGPPAPRFFSLFGESFDSEGIGFRVERPCSDAFALVLALWCTIRRYSFLGMRRSLAGLSLTRAVKSGA